MSPSAITVAAETVRTELTVLAPGVMLAGAKEHCKPWGKPEQVRLIALLKAPDFGAAVTDTLPDPPDEIVKEAGVVPKVKAVPLLVPPVQVELS